MGIVIFAVNLDEGIEMQYVLTQAELDALTPVKRLQERNEALEDARKIIVKLAGVPCQETYCSECPISDIGYYKHDDPKAISNTSSRLICSQYRECSK